MDVLAQSALLAGLTGFGVGLQVLSQESRNRLIVFFASMCGAVGLWALSFFLEKVAPGRGFYRIHLVANVWLAPGTLEVIRLMTLDRSSFFRGLRGIAWLASTLLTLVLALEWDLAYPLLRTLIYFAPFPVVLEVFSLAYRDWRGEGGLGALGLTLRGRVLVYVGTLLVLGTSLQDHVPSLGAALPVFGNIGLVVYLMFLGRAISGPRVSHPIKAISRGLVLVLLSIVWSSLYTMVFAWTPPRTLAFFLNAFFVTLLILTQLDPLRSFVGWLSRLLLPLSRSDVGLSLEEARRQLVSLTSVHQCVDQLAASIRSITEPDRIVIYLLKDTGAVFSKQKQVGLYDHSPPDEVIRDLNLLSYLEKESQKNGMGWVELVDLQKEVERASDQPQKQWNLTLIAELETLQSDVILTLRDEGRVLGFVGLSGPQHRDLWPDLDVLLLEAGKVLKTTERFKKQAERDRLASLGEMAATLAHEIRNPLGAIRGAAQILEESVSDPSFAKIIREEADRLNRTVSQFLDYSKPNRMRQESVDLSLILERLSRIAEFQWVRPSKPVRAICDPDQIQQVVWNLVQNAKNAVKLTAHPVVQVVLIDSESEVQIVVEDNGPGIPKDQLDRIFEPFVTGTTGGLGLGLAVCKRVVDAHRGRIEVSSEEGRFTRFSVILPKL